MKKTITPIVLSDMAFYFNLELNSKNLKSIEICELNDNFTDAGKLALTYLTEQSPGRLYRCNAAVVLVPHKMKNILTLDEGVQVVAVDDPAATFELIFKSLN